MPVGTGHDKTDKCQFPRNGQGNVACKSELLITNAFFSKNKPIKNALSSGAILILKRKVMMKSFTPVQ